MADKITKGDRMTTKGDSVTTKGDRMTTKGDRMTTKGDSVTTESPQMFNDNGEELTPSGHVMTAAQKHRRDYQRILSTYGETANITTMSKEEALDRQRNLEKGIKEIGLQAADDMREVQDNPEAVYLGDMHRGPSNTSQAAVKHIDGLPQDPQNTDRIHQAGALHQTQRPRMADEELILAASSVTHDPRLFMHLLNMSAIDQHTASKMAARVGLPQFPLIVVTDSSRMWDADTERDVYDHTTTMTPFESTDQLTQKELLRQDFFEQMAEKQITICEKNIQADWSAGHDLKDRKVFHPYFWHTGNNIQFEDFQANLTYTYSSIPHVLGREPSGLFRADESKGVHLNGNGVPSAANGRKIQITAPSVIHNGIIKSNYHTVPTTYRVSNSSDMLLKRKPRAYFKRPAGYEVGYSTSLVSNYLAYIQHTLAMENTIGDIKPTFFQPPSESKATTSLLSTLRKHMNTDEYDKVELASPVDSYRLFYQYNILADTDRNVFVNNMLRTVHSNRSTYRTTGMTYTYKASGNTYPILTVHHMGASGYANRSVRFVNVPVEYIRDDYDTNFKIIKGPHTDYIKARIYEFPKRYIQPNLNERAHCSPLRDKNNNFRYILPENIYNPFYTNHPLYDLTTNPIWHNPRRNDNLLKHRRRPNVYSPNFMLNPKAPNIYKTKLKGTAQIQVKTAIVCSQCNAFLSDDTVLECDHLVLRIHTNRNYIGTRGQTPSDYIRSAFSSTMFPAFKRTQRAPIQWKNSSKHPGAIDYTTATHIATRHTVNPTVFTIYVKPDADNKPMTLNVPTESLFDIHTYVANSSKGAKKANRNKTNGASGIQYVSMSISHWAKHFTVPIHATPQEPNPNVLYSRFNTLTYLKDAKVFLKKIPTRWKSQFGWRKKANRKR